jgi:hypothetical protein
VFEKVQSLFEVTHGSVGRLRNDADKSLRYGHGGFIIAPLLPAAQSGGRPRTTDIRAVVNAIFGSVAARSGAM